MAGRAARVHEAHKAADRETQRNRCPVWAGRCLLYTLFSCRFGLVRIPFVARRWPRVRLYGRGRGCLTMRNRSLAVCGQRQPVTALRNFWKQFDAGRRTRDIRSPGHSADGRLWEDRSQLSRCH